MNGFKTLNNMYYVDLEEKKVKGGAVGNAPKEYEKAIIIIGCPAVFYFKDGTLMRTSTVQDYI